MAHFEQRKRSKWDKYQRKARVLIPSDARADLEDSITFIDEDQYLSDLENSIPLFLLDYMAKHRRDIPRSSGSIQTANKRYQGPFEKRLYLVDFVARESKSITLNHIVNRSFTPHRRIKWKQVCDRWNQTHPYDTRTVPALKARYYQYTAQPDLQREYFDRQEREIAEAMAPLLQPLVQGMRQLGQVMGPYFARMADNMTKLGLAIAPLVEAAQAEMRNQSIDEGKRPRGQAKKRRVK